HLIATNPILIGIQVAAVLLMIWARVTFGIRSFHATASTSEGKLVTNGAYHYWRHPIYTSIIYFVWAGQIQQTSLLSIALALLLTAALVTRMLIEEHYLKQTYLEYTDYMKRAKRIIPFVF
ncbi:MAG TPA: methyltransferase, partial [Balneolales bacterium]|nr:methyltransferase [Balneolales bacterium]